MSNNDLNLLSKYLLLFADDIVLFTTDPASLQAQVDNVFEYSCKWGLKINVNKTKICVFEKRKSVHNFNLFINGQLVEKVDSFTYLGVKFSYTGSFVEAVKALSDQGLRAYHNLLALFDRVKFDVKTKLYLFERMVAPILLYGSEVWGIYKLKDIDKLQIRFYKYVLGVKRQTPNCAIYGELGKFPLSVLCKERALQFWNKIVKRQQAPIYHIYLDQCINGNDKCWAKRVHSVITDMGFPYIIYDYAVNVNYNMLFKQRIRDQFLQQWHDCIDNMPKLDYYKKYKTQFCFEEYLNFVKNDNLRKQLSCFRLCSHSLEIETGRYMRTDRNNRLCKLCPYKNVESEYHFLLCCPLYSELRKSFIKHVSFPTLNKFYSIMSSGNKSRILQLCKFLDKAFALRSSVLETMQEL